MTLTDKVIASMGLPRHPTPHEIAKVLREAASRLEQHGLDAIDKVSVLSARGYPAATLGDGGSRGSDETSSTERHATGRDRSPEARWFGADADYAQTLQQLDRFARLAVVVTDEIMRHALDVDPTPAGTGECLGCGRFCRPDGDKPGNRLRSGLCPTCYRAWARAGRPLRGEWVAQRRKTLTDDEGILHTPEPDHDLDLSSEAS